MTKTPVELDTIHAWPTDSIYKTLCRVPGDWISGLVITQDAGAVTCPECVKISGIATLQRAAWRMRCTLKRKGDTWRAECSVMDIKETRFTSLFGEGATGKEALTRVLFTLQEHLAKEII